MSWSPTSMRISQFSGRTDHGQSAAAYVCTSAKAQVRQEMIMINYDPKTHGHPLSNASRNTWAT